MDLQFEFWWNVTFAKMHYMILKNDFSTGVRKSSARSDLLTVALNIHLNSITNTCQRNIYFEHAQGKYRRRGNSIDKMLLLMLFSFDVIIIFSYSPKISIRPLFQQYPVVRNKYWKTSHKHKAQSHNKYSIFPNMPLQYLFYDEYVS